MTLFLLTFFTLYSLLHLHFFLKLRAFVKPGQVSAFFIWVFLFLMILSPLIIRILERDSFEKAATVLSYIGYTWMGFIFMFFSYSVFCDLCSAMYVAVAHKNFNPSGIIRFIIPLFVSLSFVAYGFYEAKKVKIERITIETERLPKDIGFLRIVQISDVHVGLLTRDEDLREKVERVKRLNPHIIVSTGDLVDGDLDRIESLIEYFSSLDPPLGKFAVTGNHEYYAGIKRARKLLEGSGFKILSNEVFQVKKGINIVGIDDYFLDSKKELKLLNHLSQKDLTIVLKHRPIVSKESIGLFDLQLSGHTHGGQIFPFRLITRVFFENVSGYKILNERSRLYVSRGMGTWGPPLRVFSPPEVTVIDLLSTDFKRPRSESNM